MKGAVVALAIASVSIDGQAQRGTEPAVYVPVDEFWTFAGDESGLWYLTRASCDTQRQRRYDVGGTSSLSCRSRKPRYAWVVSWDNESGESEMLLFANRSAGARFVETLQRLNRNAMSVGARPGHTRLRLERSRIRWGRWDEVAGLGSGQDPDAFAERVASEIESLLRAVSPER